MSRSGVNARAVFLFHRRQLSKWQSVTDRIPVHKKRKAVEKAVKSTLSRILPATKKFRVLHHESRSNLDLQIVDYFTWAIYRKWSKGDNRACSLIAPALKSEIEVNNTIRVQ